MADVQRRSPAGFRPLTLFIAVDSKNLYSRSYPADPFVWLSVYRRRRMWMTSMCFCVINAAQSGPRLGSECSTIVIKIKKKQKKLTKKDLTR